MFDPRVRLHSVGRENHEVARLMFPSRTIVRYWHKADMRECAANVRYWG